MSRNGTAAVLMIWLLGACNRVEAEGDPMGTADDEDVRARYNGKKIFEGDKLESIVMMKGEGNDWSKDPHKVDGMSGATLTAKGLNNMLKDYFICYENYLKKNKKN